MLMMMVFSVVKLLLRLGPISVLTVVVVAVATVGMSLSNPADLSGEADWKKAPLFLEGDESLTTFLMGSVNTADPLEVTSGSGLGIFEGECSLILVGFPGPMLMYVLVVTSVLSLLRCLLLTSLQPMPS